MSEREIDSIDDTSQECEMQPHGTDDVPLFSTASPVSICNHPSCSRFVGCNQTPITPSYCPAPLSDGNGN